MTSCVQRILSPCVKKHMVNVYYGWWKKIPLNSSYCTCFLFACLIDDFVFLGNESCVLMKGRGSFFFWDVRCFVGFWG